MDTGLEGFTFLQFALCRTVKPRHLGATTQIAIARTRDMTLRILMVDDSKLARMVMASAIRRLRPQWELLEATNADGAIAAIAHGSVDIALVDFNMPGTDGLELVAMIRKTHPTMPVAIVSAN